MRNQWSRGRSCPGLLLGVGLIGLLGAGLARAAEPAAAVVSQPVQREVTDLVEFTGRLEAARAVQLRARVSGYLTKLLFKAGADVKEGEVLFQIDPRPYEVEVQRVQAKLNQARARVKRLNLDLQRAQAHLRRNDISREEVDKISGERDEAEAALKVAEANVRLAQINLEYTQVRAPIPGRIGRALITPGNLVKADETLLATVVSLEPMYAYFDVDERTWLRYRREANEGKIKSARAAAVPVALGLLDEKGFPHAGTLQIIDNHVNPATGTIRMRAVFANPRRLFLPGLFVRVQLPLGKPHPALLVAEAAVRTDLVTVTRKGVIRSQARKYLLVVNDKQVIERRDVQQGGQDGGLRIIKEGLKPEDWVVVSGSPKLRPGDLVKSRRTAMPRPTNK